MWRSNYVEQTVKNLLSQQWEEDGNVTLGSWWEVCAIPNANDCTSVDVFMFKLLRTCWPILFFMTEKNWIL